MGKYCACDPRYSPTPVASGLTETSVHFFLYGITLKVTFVLNFNKNCLAEIWHTHILHISDTKSLASKIYFYYMYSPYGTQFHILQVLFSSFSVRCPLLGTALHPVT